MVSFNLGKWRVDIKQETIVTFLMLAFAMAYFIESRKLSYESLLFPRFLFICIAITGFLSIRKSVNIRRIKDDCAEEETEKVKGIQISKRLIFFVLVTFLMILLFNILGAILSIGAFLFVTMLYLKVKNKLQLVLVPVCTTAIIYAVFKVWLSVQLPVGILGF
ncbi:MAG TPA: tripartite tricarboxylate transporter TctB family protein [Clostridia bacterium]|nr:tripartite tricarboxylate transporter TctB family protein [Clostridia bacterium]